jgi:hypothetical protein
MNIDTWRYSLIGSNIKQYRQTDISPRLKIEEYVLNVDFVRTFPTDPFFKVHENSIKKIVRFYVEKNPGMGYFQGLCFLTFPLYYIYYVTEPEYVEQDTYYSLLTITSVIRPALPLHRSDYKTVQFNDVLNKLVYFRINIIDKKLHNALKKNEIVEYLVLQMIPALFANKFMLHDVIILWNYLFKDRDGIFDRIINILVGFVLHHKLVYLTGTYEQQLTLSIFAQNNNGQKIINILNLL